MSAIDLDIRRLAQPARRAELPWAVSTRPGIRLLESDTAHVRVRVAGRGRRTLVFACDMPNVVESYDVVIQALEEDFRVVCFEQVGFGFSFPKPGFSFTRKAYVDAMVEMLRALDLGPYVLVSPCVNVFTALSVAHEHPELVERLVLMQAIRWRDQCRWAGWAIGRFMLACAGMPVLGKDITRTPYLGQWIWARIERPFARRTHPHVIYRAKERQARFQQIAEPLYDAHDHGAATCYASAYQNYFDPDDIIPTVSLPALVLWASADRGHAQADPRALLEYAPGAAWVEIANAGHHLDLEQPEAVAASIRDFLR
jgi:pimeloyl-ACP methyl ester carboxylesterase